MKSAILLCSLLLNVVVFLASGRMGDYVVNKSTAEVDKLDGVMIFTNCQPVSEYTLLGTVKVGFGGPEYEGVRDELMKKARKAYPTGNGVIMRLNAGGADQADVILIK